jgi:hypothetical protein
MTRSYKFTPLPKKGESLIVNNMLIVGSSIVIVSSGFSKSAMYHQFQNLQLQQ